MLEAKLFSLLTRGYHTPLSPIVLLIDDSTLGVIGQSTGAQVVSLFRCVESEAN